MNSIVRPTLDPPQLRREIDILENLDRFLVQLQAAQDVQRQLRTTLEMVRGLTQCDLTVLYSAATREVLDWVAPRRPDLNALCSLAEQLLEHASPSESTLLRAFKEPFSETLSVRGVALVRLSRSRGVWLLALRQAGPLGPRELNMMILSRRLLQQQQSQVQAQDRLCDMMFSLVRCLAAALDARDPYTWGHSERVARIAVRLAEHLRLPASTSSELYLGGLLHDIGKIGVPDQVLRKPGRLEEAEMALVREHVVIGEAIVSHVRQMPQLRAMVRHHHEHFDGTGYPDGLMGESIPQLARILAVADAFDAMMSNRPYRKAMDPARIEAIFQAGSASQWDPVIVDALLECKADIFAICQRGIGDSVVKAVEQALQDDEGVAGAMRSFLGTMTRPELPK